MIVLAFGVVVLLAIFVIPLPKNVEVDYYDLHVWECEQAHAYNLSYSLCSGFWHEPTEDPKTIPYGSCAGVTKKIVVFGIYSWVTSPWYA